MMKQKVNILPTIEKEYTNIFNQYSHQLCDLLYKRFGDYEKAKDITQESFLKLWNNRYKVSYKKVKGYLFVVANNTYINSLYKNKVRNNYAKEIESERHPVSTMEAPDYKMEEKDFLIALQAAINKLPPKQREVLIMNRFDLKSYKEVATKLNISIKTVEKRMQAAFIAITKAVGKDIKKYRL
ncbi:RNA polymerase sigma-70 factor [Aquimarina sp. RZ0]|nr:RNA polymerase sigma-70 factor [Aquimarina sp. RZ0]